MPDLLADVNIEGHVCAIVRIIEEEFGSGALNSVNCKLLEWNSIGLPKNAKDQLVWRKAQEIGAVLVTNNRNRKDASSLNATILNENKLGSLPVLTLADANRVKNDRSYAVSVAIRLMEILMEIDVYRGTGRLYLP